MIKTVSDAVRVLFASSLVWVCEAIDENLARWVRRRVGEAADAEEPQRIRPREGS